MAGSHITEQHTFKFRGSDQHELLNITTYKPHEDDLFDFHDWNESPNLTDTTNSGANTAESNIANQEHQNYYDQQDQQYVACTNNGGLEQVTLELIPDIFLEEEEKDGFHQWAGQYDQWDNRSYMPVNEDDVRCSHIFNVDNPVFNLTKIIQDGTSI
mmetsp:Transcript_51472/g.52449  ORF Transcript_51472/g.52449 Transcript_51472/m.52449 type:complete len:157 (+) Transcript_51472:402-872(+)